jgi:integrase
LRVLEGYFEKHAVQTVVLNEEFIDSLLKSLVQDGEFCGRLYSIHVRRKVPHIVRMIANEYLLPKGVINRRILLEVEINKYRRFWKLTPQSQAAIKWFEENGRVIKARQVYVSDESNNTDGVSSGPEVVKYKYSREDEELSSGTKEAKIYAALRLLEHAGKNGFELLTLDDGANYIEHNQSHKKPDDDPVDAATFCINIQPEGFIEKIPFANLSLKKSFASVRTDFYSKEAIDHLKDLSTVNYQDKFDVRNRAMALVAYDLAVRLGELLALELSDLYKEQDGQWSVRLRSEIQKGKKGAKPEVTFLLFFDETAIILDKYLKVRPEFDPKSDRLFVSNTGEALGAHCRKELQQHCQKLGAMTFYGKKGSPHCFRHSFATLNIQPLGLQLPLDEIIKRLRHVKPETAQRHYIHDNPYLQKQKHELFKNGAKKKTLREILSQASWSDLDMWFSEDMGLTPATVMVIRAAFRKMQAAKAGGKGTSSVVYIDESFALDRLKHLDISQYSLRQYASEKSKCQCDSDQSLRYGDSFRYEQEFIDDLASNWIAAKDLMTKLKLTLTDFYRSLKRKGWRNIKIGRTCYVCKADCL